MAAHLLGIDRDRVAGNGSLAGGLFESFARMELVKQAERASSLAS